uniref:NRF domain-containing protein n=1 Tax=Macrostomum lignano TaxID=282301 RepID=A0A1I8FKS6_9PLAT
MILKLSAASSLSLAALLLLLLPLLAAAAGGEVSYNSFWRRLDSFRPVADAADGGVSRPTLEAAARLLSADGASLRQAALEALETFVRAEQAAASFAVASDGNESISACANHTPSHLLMALSKGEGWALKFLDSDAKPPAALAYGARLWLGNYDQCMAVGRSDPIEIYGAADEHRSDPLPIRGSYCLLAPLRRPGGSGRASRRPRVQRASLGPLLAGQLLTPAQINNLTQLLLSPLQKLLPANAVSSGAASGYSVPPAPSPAALDAGRSACSASSAASWAAGTRLDLVRTYRLSWRSLCRSRKQLLVNEDEEADAETATADGISAAAADGGGHLVNGIANGGHETASSFSAIAARTGCRCHSAAYCSASRCLTNAPQDRGRQPLRGHPDLRTRPALSVHVVGDPGHTYYFAFGSLNNMGQLYAGWQNDWTFQVIANATVSVDSFFVLSGLLSHLPRMGRRASQNQLADVLRTGGLTPPYLLVMATYVSLFQYVYEGARCTRRRRPPSTRSAHGLVKNALYINNLFSAESGAGAPLLFCLLAIKPALGVGVTSALLLASVTAMGIHSTVNGLAVGFFGIARRSSGGIYIKPWFRATPYLVGVLSAAICCTVSRSAAAAAQQHACTASTMWTAGRVKLSQNVASLYNAVYRPLWAAAVAWVTIACVTGKRRLGEQSAVAAAVCPAISAYLLRLPGALGTPVVMLAYYLRPQAG